MLVKGSFEDYFYILAGLVWVAFSIYKSVQKKKAKGNPNEKVKKKSVLETLMDEFLEKGEQKVPEPIVLEADPEELNLEEETEEKTFSYDDIYEKSNYNEVLGVYEKKSETKAKLKTNLKTLPKSRKTSRFNLRKAVIYSEILNRPHF